MSFLSAICLALAVNPGRVALWVVQPLILCVLYLVLRARHQRIRAAAIAEDRRRIAAALHDGISQEAISNAVRHGHAKNVRIASGPLEGGGFRLSVMNDGERFDPERALGPETGHFGLSAMRERATRSGFTFAFRERDGYFGLEMERKD